MMNLTPEQKAAGKQALGSDVTSGQTRCDFLKTAAVAGLVSGGSLGAFYFGYEATLPKPIRVAVLGTGDEGSVLIGAEPELRRRGGHRRHPPLQPVPRVARATASARRRSRSGRG